MPGDQRLVVQARVLDDQRTRERLDVDLAFDVGITVVTGPSGAGKTTLLSTIAGLVRPVSGRIALGGTVFFDDDARVFMPAYRRRVALVFQSLALFPHLNVWQNVAYGMPPVARDARRERALVWLERARVADVVDRAPASLSGGEAQRVALARALASEPRVLLLDEPFSALDRALRGSVRDDVKRLVDEARIPCVLVTHDLEDVRALSAPVFVIESGRAVQEPARVGF
jgi:molybdate transport system ATP-binding protein